MNLADLERKLIAAARRLPPSEAVPYAFEKRIMAHLRARPALDEWSLWARALWRAAAPCVAPIWDSGPNNWDIGVADGSNVGKDINPINTGVSQDWSCAPVNNPTNKDDIQNAYAAVFRVPLTASENAGHTMVVMGVAGVGIGAYRRRRK